MLMRVSERRGQALRLRRRASGLRDGHDGDRHDRGLWARWIRSEQAVRADLAGAASFQSSMVSDTLGDGQIDRYLFSVRQS